jgi:superfamily II DNA or RNA helicase
MTDYQQSKETYSKKNRYVDLTINGRLFPSWILANFKKYKLPDVVRTAGEDPCKGTIDSGKVKHELKKYQVFLSNFLDYKSPYRNILIYHGLGSGKTASAINIYNVLYNYTPGWNVFMLIKASLKGSWLDELKKWLKQDEYEFRFKNIMFIHYDSPFADKNFLDAIKNVDSAKKSLYIIDETHNFIRNVYSNISSTKGKRAQIIYDYIIQDKKENPDTRVILLSGTPAINNPYEVALLFNLLRPGSFPKSENEFNHHYISSTAYQTLNKNNKNMFQRRIMGLVSFYIGSTPDVYATKTIQYVDIKMSSYQQDIYKYYEELEDSIAMRARFVGRGGSQTYKSYTRQACNFVFPQISQRVNGESRPRPGKFRITEREAEKLSEGREAIKGDKKDKDKFTNISQYREAMDTYINSFDEYLRARDSHDVSNKRTIMDDVKVFLTKYGGNFSEFHKGESKKSTLYDAMYMCSAKMTTIIFNIMMSKGPTVVYSNYVYMEGIEILKIYLKYFGFYNYMIDKKLKEGATGYVEFHGGIKEIEDRYAGMRAFNMPGNKHGELIKIMLVSSAGAEGLSLMNVRQVHIMEPYWNEVRITQMIGRGIRQCSHKDLPPEERHVDVFRYKSVKSAPEPEVTSTTPPKDIPNRAVRRWLDPQLQGKSRDVKRQQQQTVSSSIYRWTTDQYIEDIARSKDSLIQSFLDSMKEVAVDCALNKAHNMLAQEYKCFQFEEPSLFDKYIGPAYREDMYDDMRFDNGSNSNRSVTLKIKVMKIRAVKQLTPATEGGNAEYSKVEDYWFYPDSRTVYDYELQYPVGKVAVDDSGMPIKLNKDTYVIDYVIPIPLLEDDHKN